MPIPPGPDELRNRIRYALEGMPRQFLNVETCVSTFMKVLEQYDPTYAKATINGEPHFTLRAQDKSAPARIEDWCDFCELNGVAERKIEEARFVAAAMRAWPTRKIPD